MLKPAHAIDGEYGHFGHDVSKESRDRSAKELLSELTERQRCGLQEFYLRGNIAGAVLRRGALKA